MAPALQRTVEETLRCVRSTHRDWGALFPRGHCQIAPNFLRKIRI